MTQQIATAYNSASGVQVRDKLTSLVTDPALPQAVQALLKSGGPAGSNTLTAFQVDLLNALITATKDPAVLSDMIAGKSGPPFSSTWLDQLRLRTRLASNPAIRVLTDAGSKLKHASELPADIAAGATGAQTSYASLTPPATADQGGSAALDKIIGDFASLRMSSDFGNYAAQVGPVLVNPGFRDLVKEQSPLAVAQFLPAAELAGLQIPTGHNFDEIFTASLLSDIQTAVVDIIVPIALFVIGLVYLPVEVPVVVAIATLVGAIYTGEQVAEGVITIANDLDCDHDGDSFDPADVPGQEC